MSIKKQYLKSRPICKVTFRLPKEAAGEARLASLVGEFNSWDDAAHPMRRLKDGSFKVTVDLAPDTSYQFRYLLDERLWENDGEADGYARTPFGDGDNSILKL